MPFSSAPVVWTIIGGNWKIIKKENSPQEKQRRTKEKERNFPDNLIIFINFLFVSLIPPTEQRHERHEKQIAKRENWKAPNRRRATSTDNENFHLISGSSLHRDTAHTRKTLVQINKISWIHKTIFLWKPKREQLAERRALKWIQECGKLKIYDTILSLVKRKIESRENFLLLLFVHALLIFGWKSAQQGKFTQEESIFQFSTHFLLSPTCDFPPSQQCAAIMNVIFMLKSR